MTLTEAVYAQTRVMVPKAWEGNHLVLEVLCRSACGYLRSRLKDTLNPEDCREDFVSAASLLALASLMDVGGLEDGDGLEQITAGDLTLRRRKDTTDSHFLRSQAENMMKPYLRDGFAFVGV